MMLWNPLPLAPFCSTAQGFQLANLVFESNELMFNSAVETYMKELQEEQGEEQGRAFSRLSRSRSHICIA
jgi:hypothetical protein